MSDINWKNADEHWILEAFNKKTNKWGAYPTSPTLSYDEILIKAVLLKEKNSDLKFRMVKMKRLEIRDFVEEAAE